MQVLSMGYSRSSYIKYIAMDGECFTISFTYADKFGPVSVHAGVKVLNTAVAVSGKEKALPMLAFMVAIKEYQEAEGIAEDEETEDY